MRSCDEILELISAALDGELTGPERQELDAHLHACPACSALLEELSGLRDASAELEEPPAGFTGQVMAQIAANPAQDRLKSVIPFPAKKRSRVPWKGWAASAAVVAVVLLGVFALPGRQSASDNGAVRAANGGAAPAGTADIDNNAEIAPESEPTDETEDAACIPEEFRAEVQEASGAADSSLDADVEAGQEAPDFAPVEHPTENSLFDPPAPAFATQEPNAPSAPTSKENPPSAVLSSVPTPTVYCGVLVLTGEPLPEGLEDFESTQEENGAVSYVVPASYFYSNSSKLSDEMASNFIDCSEESNTDPTAEYGLIIVEPPAE